WWMLAPTDENTSPPLACGPNDNWRNARLLLDRDRAGAGRDYGVALSAGRVVFGVGGGSGAHHTLCGSAVVTDGRWHHVAVARRRSDGYLWIWVDGRLDAWVDGPNGDIAYPDDAAPAEVCGLSGREPCADDPYL